MPNIAVGMVDFDSPEEEEILSKGGDPLRDLCRNEVESFDAFLKDWATKDPAGDFYSEGLALWERRVVEGFLYQKLMNRF